MKIFLTLLMLGALANLSAQVSDVRGSMLHFDGMDDHVNLGTFGGAFTTTTTEATLEVWVYFDQVETRTVSLIEQRSSGVNGPLLSLETGTGVNEGKFSVFAGGPFYGRTNTRAVVANEWLHCALVYDGSQSTNAERLKLYINGVEQALTFGGWGGAPVPSSFVLDSNPFYLAAERGNNQFAPVTMDEVRIWKTVRSQSEIRENMHLTLAGNETGLVAYYQFNNDDAPGIMGGVKDGSGNNHHATTGNMNAADYVASQVAVAKGVSERQTVTASGVNVFPNTGVSLDFGGNPNGEIVVSRLTTEAPSGASSIGYDVDDEYFVVYNYGTTNAAMSQITLEDIQYLNGTTAASDIHLYQRGARQHGATWTTALDTATSFVPSPTGQVVFDLSPAANRLVSSGQFVIAQMGSSTIDVQQVPTPAVTVEVFPNPATDHVQVHWANVAAPAQWVVINAQGQVVYQASANQPMTTIETQHWAAGCYVIALVQDNGPLLYQQKLLVR